MEPITFTAAVTAGAGRGKTMGIPTLNVSLADVPSHVQEGVYAGLVNIRSESHFAAIHYGPRPVFHDSKTFEAHLLDTTHLEAPKTVTITLVARLRDVRNFPSPEELVAQIDRDIARTRAILKSPYAPHTP